MGVYRESLLLERITPCCLFQAPIATVNAPGPAVIPRHRPDLDGLRLIEPGRQDIWLIYLGLRHIVGRAVSENLFSDMDQVVVSDEIAEIAEGEPLNEGSCLVREHGGLSIFLLTGSLESLRLHHVVTYETFLDFGFDLGKVIDAPKLLLEQVAQGRRLSSAADRSTRQRWLGPTKESLAILRTFISAPRQKLQVSARDKLIVCTHGLPPGGAERQWVYLAHGLARKGFEVVFLVLDGLEGENGHYLSHLQESSIRVVDGTTLPQAARLPEPIETYLSSNYAPERHKLRLLTFFLRAERPKAVFAQLDQTNILCGIAANLADVPRVVLSFRNSNPTHFHYMDSDWFQPIYRELAHSPSVTLSGNSRAGNGDYAEWLAIRPEEIKFIPNAIDDSIFVPPSENAIRMARSELGLSGGTPVLLGVFRLSAEKDPLSFLRVCVRVLSAHPDLQVLVAGVGPFHRQLTKRIHELGLEGRVQLLGRRSDINVLMRLANVLLLTSMREGMPNVLLEAQISGLPIVATRVGGVTDTVVDGATAFLHDSGDVESLARSCLSVLNDAALAERMSLAARERAHLFSSDALAVGHLSLL